MRTPALPTSAHPHSCLLLIRLQQLTPSGGQEVKAAAAWHWHETLGQLLDGNMGNEASLPLDMCATFDAEEIKRLGKRQVLDINICPSCRNIIRVGLFCRFKKLDLDNSGSLSVDEFMSLPELQQNPLVQRVIGGNFDRSKRLYIICRSFQRYLTTTAMEKLISRSSFRECHSSVWRVTRTASWDSPSEYMILIMTGTSPMENFSRCVFSLATV